MYPTQPPFPTLRTNGVGAVRYQASFIHPSMGRSSIEFSTKHARCLAYANGRNSSSTHNSSSFLSFPFKKTVQIRNVYSFKSTIPNPQKFPPLLYMRERCPRGRIVLADKVWQYRAAEMAPVARAAVAAG